MFQDGDLTSWTVARWLQEAACWHSAGFAATFPGTIQYGFHHHVAAAEFHSGKIATGSSCCVSHTQNEHVSIPQALIILGRGILEFSKISHRKGCGKMRAAAVTWQPPITQKKFLKTTCRVLGVPVHASSVNPPSRGMRVCHVIATAHINPTPTSSHFHFGERFSKIQNTKPKNNRSLW
jgi:hypothetical protein